MNYYDLWKRYVRLNEAEVPTTAVPATTPPATTDAQPKADPAKEAEEQKKKAESQKALIDLQTAIKTIQDQANKLQASLAEGWRTYIVEQQPAPQQAAQPVVKESIYKGAHLDDGTLVCEACLEELLESQRTIIQEAKYQGRTVTLNKPTAGDVKKFKVYVKDPTTGNVKKVNFGDPNMKIKKNIPARRKSFRARHNCDNPGPKTKARYWSCKKW